MKKLILGLLVFSNFATVQVLAEDTLDLTDESISSQETSQSSTDKDESNDILGEEYEHGDVSIVLTDVYLTDERDEYEDKSYDHVIIVEYEFFNHSDEEEYTSDELELYVNGKKADNYHNQQTVFENVSAGRGIDSVKAFAFNGDFEVVELELRDRDSDDKTPVVIDVTDLVVN
ncbi:hypothetical protein ACWOBE_06840 [Hutsoniella sourekii]